MSSDLCHTYTASCSNICSGRNVDFYTFIGTSRFKDLFKVYKRLSLTYIGAIFVWTWKENARTKQKQQTNWNRAICDWFIERLQTRVDFGWLSEHSGEKTSCPKNFLEINRYFDWRHTVTRLANRTLPFPVRVFFGGKTESPCFDLFIHWLIKQITNTYRNHFLRSCKTWWGKFHKLNFKKIVRNLSDKFQKLYIDGTGI